MKITKFILIIILTAFILWMNFTKGSLYYQECYTEQRGQQGAVYYSQIFSNCLGVAPFEQQPTPLMQEIYNKIVKIFSYFSYLDFNE